MSRKRSLEISLAESCARVTRPRLALPQSSTGPIIGEDPTNLIVVRGEPWERLREFKRCLREQRLGELRLRKAQENNLDQWEASGGKDIVRDAMEQNALLPKLGNRLAEFVGRPGDGCNSFVALTWRPSQIPARVARALDIKKNSKAARALQPALRAVMTQLCSTYQSVQEPAVDEAEPETRLCHTSGMCVCQGAGLQLRQVSDKLNKIIKNVCRPSSALRRKLQQGEICLLFVGQTKQQWNGAGEETNLRSVWAHVSEQCLSPWVPGYQRLQNDDAIKSGSAAPVAARVIFTNVWQAKMFFLRELDLQLQWRVAVYEVAFEARMLGTFVPNCLDVVLVENNHFEECWCPWEHKKKRRAPAARGGWGRVLAGLEDGSVEGEHDVDETDEESDDNSNVASLHTDSACEKKASDSNADPSDSSSSSSSSSGGSDAAAGASGANGEHASSDGVSDFSLDSYESVISIADRVLEEVGFGDADEDALSMPAEDYPISDSDDPGPSAPAAPIVRAPGERHPAAVTVHLGRDQHSSSLVWYDSGNFVAYCRSCGPRCRLTRSSKAGRRAATGRPLGLLYWWLLRGFRADSCEAHKADCYPTKAQRARARAYLKLVDGSAELFNKERKKTEDESGSEPDDVP